MANISFGSTAAIVSSMALIVGLGSISHGKASLIAALLVIAIADNITDTFSIHIYQESTTDNALPKAMPITNYAARLIVSMSFVVIVLLLPATAYKLVGVIWGMALLITMSFFIVRKRSTSPIKEISYHVLLALFVIVISQLLGTIIDRLLT